MSEMLMVDTETGEIQANGGNIGALARRLVAASMEVGSVEKRGRNAHFQYDYATAEDIKRAARVALFNNGVAIIPLMNEVTQTGKKTMVQFNYVVACEEASLTVSWFSESQDSGDKGINKCATNALKYFLINLLQIPTGEEEDPDADGKPPQKSKFANAPAQKTQSAKHQSQKPKPNGNKPMTLKEAGALKTSKGTAFSDLDAKQLVVALEHVADGSLQQIALKMLHAEKTKSDNSKSAQSWPGETIAALIKQFKINSTQTLRRLNKSKIIGPADGVDTVMEWMLAYSNARESADSSDAAAQAADDAIKAILDAPAAQATFDEMTS